MSNSSGNGAHASSRESRRNSDTSSVTAAGDAPNADDQVLLKVRPARAL
jgi:hypothetical protein